MRTGLGDSVSNRGSGVRTLFRGLAGALALALVPVLAGSEVAYYDDNLPTTLNPVLSRTMADVRTSELVFDRLFYRSAITNEPKSRVVSGYERQDDGKQLKLVLREGIKWHDGKDLGPDDICFTVDVLRDANTSSENTKEYRETLVSCEVLKSENAVVITLDKAYYNPRDRVSFHILPKHLFPNTTVTQSDEFNARPIGTGPMKASRGKHEIRLTAVPNVHHNAKISTLILNEGADPLVQVRTLLTGGIQGIISVAPSYRPDVAAASDVALKSYDLRSWWFMALNTTSPILADKRVRQAIHLSLDRTKLREVTIGVDADDQNPPCEFVSGPFVQSSPFYNRAVPVQERSDKARAQTLMQAAGATLNAGRWVMNGQSVTLRIGMNAPLDQEARDLLNQIGNQLQEAGFDRQVYKVPADEWASKGITGGLKSNFDALIGEWSFGAVEDVNDKFHTRANGEGARNIFDYSKPEVDALLKRYSDAKTDTEAQDAYHDLHALLADELPYIFLWKLDTKSAWRNEIKGGTITPYYYFTEFDTWKL